MRIISMLKDWLFPQKFRNGRLTSHTFLVGCPFTSAARRIFVAPESYGLNIRPEGTGVLSAEPNTAGPIFLEMQKDEIFLYIWSDINQEDYTHKISLKGALETSLNNPFKKD